MEQICANSGNSYRVTLFNAKGEYRVYRILGGSSLEVKTYLPGKIKDCKEEKTYYIVNTYRIDLGKAATAEITLSKSFAEYLGQHMNLSAETKGKILNPKDEPVSRKDGYTSVSMSDAEYLSLAQRMDADLLALENKTDLQHFRMQKCE